jgi:hypothetical protein
MTIVFVDVAGMSCEMGDWVNCGRRPCAVPVVTSDK